MTKWLLAYRFSVLIFLWKRLRCFWILSSEKLSSKKFTVVKRKDIWYRISDSQIALSKSLFLFLDYLIPSSFFHGYHTMLLRPLWTRCSKVAIATSKSFRCTSHCCWAEEGHVGVSITALTYLAYPLYSLFGEELYSIETCKLERTINLPLDIPKELV